MSSYEERRRREFDKARRFWNRHEVPFEHDVRIKVRRSGLSRGSSGTGRARDTVNHLYVLEGFSEGRLSRSSDVYLCDDSARIRDSDSETISDPDGEAKMLRAVTCKRCRELMERWEMDRCPECGERLYQPSGGPELFCDNCEMTYWREYPDGDWFRCGADGEPEHVPEGSR